MYCKNCNGENLETSLNCSKCGSSLISSFVGGGNSKAYREAVRKLDARLFGRIGGFVGAGLATFFLIVVFADMYFDKQQISVGIVLGGLAGHIIGRVIGLRRRW
jgi:hypothetical protein